MVERDLAIYVHIHLCEILCGSELFFSFLIQALFLDSDTCKGGFLDIFRFMQNGLSLFSMQLDVLEP